VIGFPNSAFQRRSFLQGQCQFPIPMPDQKSLCRPHLHPATQAMREAVFRVKLNPLPDVLAGKRVW